MSVKKATRRPPIHMIESEADCLMNLAIGIEERLPDVSELLIDEITRAKIHSVDHIPNDVITMNSTVEFVDEASGKTRTVVLVFPKDADIANDKVSILTPVGAGLIGLREGASILWPDRDSHYRALTIKKVRQHLFD